MNLRTFSSMASAMLCAFGLCASAVAAPPPNDLLANAKPIAPAGTISTITDAVPNVREAGGDEPFFSCKFGEVDPVPGFNGIWYAITPDAPMDVTVDTIGSSPDLSDTMLAVFTRDGAGVFHELACDDNIDDDRTLTSRVSLALSQVGTTYLVLVAQANELHAPRDTGLVQVNFSFQIAPPPHDRVENARAIGSNSYTDTVPQAQAATVTAGDPVHACIGRIGTHNVWYRFTPPTDGQLTVDTWSSSGTYIDTLLSVTDANGAFTAARCNDDVPGGGGQSGLANLLVEAGVPYTIYVSRLAAEPVNESGKLVLNATFTSLAPANDLFANAEAVPVNTDGTLHSDTEANAKYASESDGDPGYSCRVGGAGNGFDGLWYKITTGTEPTRLIVSTADTSLAEPGGVSDTLLAVYTLDGDALTERACNDDIGALDKNSRLSLNLDAARTYYVFVSQKADMSSAATGSLEVRFSYLPFVAPPPHDLFANARVIGTNPYTDTVPNAQLATVSSGDPQHSCGTPGDSHNLWYRFTAPRDGVLHVDTIGSNGSYEDTVLSVFTGDYGGFATVGCNDRFGIGNNSRLQNLQVQGGATYTILVSRWSTTSVEMGTLVLNAAFSSISATPLFVSAGEDGSVGEYSVVLHSAPDADVTVTLTADTQVSAGVSSLTFTPANWDRAQLVTVTAIDDTAREGQHTGTISHAVASADPAYQAAFVPAVSVDIADDDVPGVMVNPTRISVAEGGAAARYGVVLTTQPTADVTVSLPASDQLRFGDEHGTDIATLVFTRDDWDQSRTVTVTAVDDALAEGRQHEEIVHGLSSEDPDYAAVGVPSVNATLVDNDAAGVSIDPTTVTVAEGGATAIYRVVLTFAPTADVTVSLAPDAGIEVSLPALPGRAVSAAKGGAPVANLVFTPADWNRPRTVMVAAIDDAEQEGPHGSAVRHAVASDDEAYDGTEASRVDVDILDNDGPQPRPDLAVTLTDDTDLVVPGALHDYVVTVAALGANGSVGARYTSVLPATLQGAAWTCAPATECPADAGNGDADLLVNLERGEHLTFTITGTVAQNARGTMTHTVEISPPASQTDSDTGNNRAVDINQVNAFADGFNDGFEDIAQGWLKRVRADFAGRSVVVERDRLAMLADLGAAVPLPVLEWELPQARGRAALHVRSLDGAQWVRLALKASGADWRWSDWRALAAGQDLRVSLESAPGAKGGEAVRLLDERGDTLAALTAGRAH
jgi:hypothetical protein